MQSFQSGAKQETTSHLVQIPWNFVEEFGIAGNPNKGHSVRSQLDQTEPWQCRRIPSIFASLSHGRYSRSRARVALGREVQLPMSFPWPVFPGLDQDLFPPWFSSFFGIRFQNDAGSFFLRFSTMDSKTVQGPWGGFTRVFPLRIPNGAKECRRVWHRRKSEQRNFG